VQFSNDAKLDLRRTFRGPYRRRPRASSLLAWLRGDLQAFYGPEARVGGPVAAPLLTALGICAGLELLAKYWSGRPDITGTVVEEFLTSVAGLSQPDAEALMQFRNSLAHGYALGARRRKDKKLFSFAIDTDHTTGAAVVVSRGSNEYTVNLWSLKRFFLTAIGRCRKAIAHDQGRLGNFQVCLRNLGEIGVRP
jgi:hypothetical protein